MDISERIKKRRLQLGLSQRQVAEKALTTQAALQKIKDDAAQASLEAQEAAAKRSIEIRREEIDETENFGRNTSKTTKRQKMSKSKRM